MNFILCTGSITIPRLYFMRRWSGFILEIKILNKIAAVQICSPIFYQIIMKIYSGLFVDFGRVNFQINPYILKVSIKTVRIFCSFNWSNYLKIWFRWLTYIVISRILTRLTNLRDIFELFQSITNILSNKEAKTMQFFLNF